MNKSLVTLALLAAGIGGTPWALAQEAAMGLFAMSASGTAATSCSCTMRSTIDGAAIIARMPMIAITVSISIKVKPD